MAEVRRIGNMQLNDGKGLYDNEGLLDNIIISCNDAVRNLMNGQYIGFCYQMHQITQKIRCVKEGMVNEKKALTEERDQLRAIIRDMGSKEENQNGSN